MRPLPGLLRQWLRLPVLVLAGLAFLLFTRFDSAGRLAIFQAGLGLGFVIFIHELGHFLAAKWCGVRVRKFSVGFGSPLPGCSFQWGETTYQIGWIPLGGFVQLVGEGAIRPEEANDPRSFRNKPVWQRLAIISAGVAMNVVLAIVCFTYVYVTRGVERIPVAIQATEIDSPAWHEGMTTGHVIQQIADKGPPLFFDDYLSVVVNSHAGQRLDVAYGPRGAAESALVRTVIEPRRSADDPKPILGILPAPGLRLLGEEARRIRPHPYLFGSAAASAHVVGSQSGDPAEGFRFDDVILATTDPDQDRGPGYDPRRLASLPTVPGTEDRPDYFAYAERMKRLAGKPVVMRVRRAEGATADLLVPPAFHATLGTRMAMGPILALRSNGPAARAGVREGDVILRATAVDSRGTTVPFGTVLDPVRLPVDLLRWAFDHPGTKKVILTLQREEEGSRREVQREVYWDESYQWGDEIPGPQYLLGIPGLGLGYQIDTRIAAVAPSSPAANVGLVAGDVIRAVRFRKMPKAPGAEGEPDRWVDLKPGEWMQVFFVLQRADSKTVDLRLEQADREVTLTAVPDEAHPLDNRGLLFVLDVRLHRATGPWEAVGMGLHKTGAFVLETYRNLRGIVTGRISHKMVGGPVAMASMAYQAASQNVYQLIVFLGIISVNLAVMNFLPIPVLDGGHAVFLLLEKIRGRPVSARTGRIATYVGLTLLLSLMGFVLFLDVTR
jgi:regulator of sigma E protease